MGLDTSDARAIVLYAMTYTTTKEQTMTAAQCRTIGTVTGQLLAYAMETPDLQLTTQPIAIEEQHAGEMTVTLQACYTNGNDFYVRAAVTPEGRVLNNVLTRAWDDERLALTEWMGITKDAVLR